MSKKKEPVKESEVEELKLQLEDASDTLYEMKSEIKEELYGLVEIEKYFQKEYSYDCQREINYLFTSYSDYGRKISSELEEKIGIENLGVYGGEEAKYCGKIYFLMYKHGEWDSVRYWAIEIDAETGELLEWKEVTKEKWIRAERSAGFRPKCSSTDDAYMTTCATGGFMGNGISGKIERG